MVTETQADDARDALLDQIDAGYGWSETGDAPYVEAETPDDAPPQWCVAEYVREHEHTEAEFLHVWQIDDDRFQVSQEDENGITWGRVYGRGAMAAHVSGLTN